MEVEQVSDCRKYLNVAASQSPPTMIGAVNSTNLEAVPLETVEKVFSRGSKAQFDEG